MQRLAFSHRHRSVSPVAIRELQDENRNNVYNNDDPGHKRTSNRLDVNSNNMSRSQSTGSSSAKTKSRSSSMTSSTSSQNSVVQEQVHQVMVDLVSVLGELKTVVGDIKSLVGQIDIVTHKIDESVSETEKRRASVSSAVDQSRLTDTERPRSYHSSSSSAYHTLQKPKPSPKPQHLAAVQNPKEIIYVNTSDIASFQNATRPKDLTIAKDVKPEIPKRKPLSKSKPPKLIKPDTESLSKSHALSVLSLLDSPAESSPDSVKLLDLSPPDEDKPGSVYSNDSPNSQYSGIYEQEMEDCLELEVSESKDIIDPCTEDRSVADSLQEESDDYVDWDKRQVEIARKQAEVMAWTRSSWAGHECYKVSLDHSLGYSDDVTDDGEQEADQELPNQRWSPFLPSTINKHVVNYSWRTVVEP